MRAATDKSTLNSMAPCGLYQCGKSEISFAFLPKRLVVPRERYANDKWSQETISRQRYDATRVVTDKQKHSPLFGTFHKQGVISRSQASTIIIYPVVMPLTFVTANANIEWICMNLACCYITKQTNCERTCPYTIWILFIIATMVSSS